MKTSSKGLDHLKEIEGIEYKAYLDTGGVWTIGVGHTGPDVHEGQLADDLQVMEWLRMDVIDAESAVNRLVKVPLTQNQFDALVSFVFNIGESQFSKSTMLRKLNAGDYTGAAAQFPRWNIDNGKVIFGLTKRRILERNLFEEQ